jgi:tRNA pseudouridine38-40 synthase
MRFYASVAYDGSHFCGFQSQPNGCAVQDHIEAVFADFFQTPVRIAATSRTDAGVHAFDQRIEWEVQTPVPPQRFPVIFNYKLRHVRLHWADFAPQNFSVRQKCCQKRYCYKIRFGATQPFFEPYYWCLPEKPGAVTELRELMELFVGNHDFRYFCKVDKTRQLTDFRRTIAKLSVDEESEAEWHVRFTGAGFLWKMVRYMVAAGFYGLNGKISPAEISRMLEGEHCSGGKPAILAPAPAHGLYLEEVFIV